MLWAIDIGNTQTVAGIHDGSEWVATWRFETDVLRTQDEWAAQLKPLLDLRDLPMQATDVVIASVVPSATENWTRFSRQWLSIEPVELKTGAQVGLRVDYEPANGVGADRIANAVGALAKYPTPLIVVDFGTATTFDALDRDGTYVGGAIMTGIEVSMRALFQRTAKLPMIELEVTSSAIGKTTTSALQSGIVRGYVGAIEALVQQISSELGGAKAILATGGLGRRFVDLCPSITAYDEWLTLDGLRLALERWVPEPR